MSIGEPQYSTICSGILAGGFLGGFVCWIFKNLQTDNHTLVSKTKQEQAAAEIQLYSAIKSDRQLASLLEEPLAVFMQVDMQASKDFLQSIQDLVTVFHKLLQGSAKPSNVSHALRTRREALNRLQALIKKSRTLKPVEISDMHEDFESIKKSLDNFVHNSMQQSNLNIMLG